jgi:hypothetical protein
MEDHPQHIDIIKLVLPKPLLPKQQITITTPFHVKLPFNFSRGGYDGESFQITQWYPKPAVYDQKGWHPMPYVDQGEFYSSFGNFDVRITLPKNYVVAATGDLQNEEEKKWLNALADQNRSNKNKVIEKGMRSKTKLEVPASASATKTIQFKQNNVHDFAWFANKTFLVDHDTLHLQSGRIIDAYSFYTEQQYQFWEKSVDYAKEAVKFFSGEIGEYPFNVVSVVQGPPSSFSGGMEYPTITLVSPAMSPKMLDQVIAHEVAHNWFQGVLASDEREHPWMDEGLASFYEDKYMVQKYGSTDRTSEILLQTKAFRKTDQPIETPSMKFSNANYGVIAYHKTAEWLRFLEEKFGKDSVRNAIRKYYDQWKFKHPHPEDLKDVFRSELAGVEPYLQLLDKNGILPGRALKGFSIVSPFKKNSIRNYFQNPTRNALLISPLAGINKYDGLMLGALFTNYKLPPNMFQFLLAPMYATRSKEVAGLGRLNYSIHTGGLIKRSDIFLNASMFSQDDFIDTAGRKILMRFHKLVPGIKLSFSEKDKRSSVEKYIQWKTFFIGEQSLRITQDSIFSGTDTSLVLRYNTPSHNRILNQLRFVYENSRKLYPYDISVNVDQAKDFIRPSITANYLFNYATGGGLNVRFFAGKFLYLGERTLKKQFRNERYHLNMTGANGYEDYTYSNYFYGRNEFEGAASQQIMIRDGGFKVRTDLLADKIGKTDDWLVALNFNSAIPANINPLNVLPLQIPLRIFLDIGTYAEAWQKNAEGDHFLFNAGLHIPLMKESINIYIPIIYNRVYSDYLKSTIPKNRFLRTISFSIDLFNKGLKDLNRQLEFQ